MAEGFDIDLNRVLNQLKDKIQGPGPQQQPQWSIWDREANPQGQRPYAQPLGPRPDLAAQQQGPRPEFPPRQDVQMPQAPNARPEQMPGTRRADEQSKQAVNQALADAQRQSYRSESAKHYMRAIDIANNSQDASLQAISKVEFGLANMSWGYSEQGFKWLLEAGSNNPTLYNPQMNQSFLKRLAQVGMPQSAVDLLIANGQKDPNWYLNDASAARKLDQAMTGPAMVVPNTPIEGPQQRPQGDPLAPPVQNRPENFNPMLEPPGQAGPWIKEQFGQTMQQAAQERNWRQAFSLYKQAVDMADRARDPSLQATARVETGLALMSWGNVETGFKWLLDAGAKNPGLYDERYNAAYLSRLSKAGIPQAAIELLIQNGQQDANWHNKDVQAAKRLEATMRNPNPEPYRPNPQPYIPQYSPQYKPQPELPQAPPLQPRNRKSPFK